ncbi:MAG: DUF4252 domain-containing protein [Eudoraea sp.]|nr:DUF4252 domain-containing protein [Eudoraea sp.]
MKKSILVLAAFLITINGFTQSQFDKFEDMENVGAVIVNKSMIDLVATIGEHSDDAEAREFMNMAQGLEQLRVFMTEDKDAAAKMKTSVNKYLRSSSLEELMRVKDEDTNVKFYIKNGKDENHVNELLMFVTGMDKVKVGHKGKNIETVLVSLTGDIDLRKIGALTKKMDLPRDLNKAEKKGK